MKYTLVLLVLLATENGSAYKISNRQLQRDEGHNEDTNVQIQNIYGIPSDQEKLQIKAQAL